jgi:integrase
MASILIKLDKRSINTRGEHPIILRIFSNQKNTSISMGFSISVEAWIKDGITRPVKVKYPAAKMINDRIEKYYLEMRQKMIAIEDTGEIQTMSAVDIKQYLLKEKLDRKKITDRFFPFAESYIEGIKNMKTKQMYEHTMSKLNEYAKKETRFSEINNQFLRKFDERLSASGSSVNTRSIHFRNIRAIFNRAIEDELIGVETYPFRKFKIVSEQKEKECLKTEQIKSLYLFDFKTKSLCMARDFWMLSFFLCGINPVDLFHLKKPDSEGRITFIRTKMSKKNHETIKLKIQPEAQEIIDRYKSADASQFLLKFESSYLDYDNFYHFLSKKTKEIAAIMQYPGLTLYWARYSWATIADALDISEKTISKGLGHTDKTLAGKTYITFDWTKVDKANRAVIDRLLAVP